MTYIALLILLFLLVKFTITFFWELNKIDFEEDEKDY